MPERRPIEFLFYPNPDSPTLSSVSIETSRNGHDAYLGIDFSLLIDRTELYEHLQELIEKHFPTLNYLAGTYPFGQAIASKLSRELHIPQVEFLDYGRKFIRPEGFRKSLNRVVILDPELKRGRQALGAAQTLRPTFEVLGVAAVFDWGMPLRQSRFEELNLKSKSLVEAGQVFQYMMENKTFPEGLIKKAISSRRRAIHQQAGLGR